MYLYINTAKLDAEIGLLNDKCEVEVLHSWQGSHNQTETLIEEIDNLLKEHSIIGGGIKGIIVSKGHGSYTDIRIGVTSANSLALSWNVPIWGIVNCSANDKEMIKNIIATKSNFPVIPKYQNPPHITKPKNVLDNEIILL